MYTEIYLADSNAEIAEYWEEMAKAKDGKSYDTAVLRKWFSQPVAIYAQDGTKMWTVLLTDEQYNDRKYNQSKLDKSFTKLNSKFKLTSIEMGVTDAPLHVFGPMGKTHHAPEERETIAALEAEGAIEK